MPDRILRSNILTSDTVNTLSWSGEVFYRRLMSIVDDFGRHDARPDILRSLLYPLKLDSVSKPDIVKWMGECSKAGLVRLYLADGREYLEILKFNQRLRIKKSKFPAPADIGGHMTANDSNLRSVEETKQNTNPISKRKEDEENFLWTDVVKNFFNDYNWKEKFCRDKNIEMSALEFKMKLFINDIELKEDFKELKELKNHFTNWFNKNLTTKNASSKTISQQKSDAAGSFLERARNEVAAIARKTGDRPQV